VATGSTGTLAWVHGSHMGVPLIYTNTAGTAVATPNYTLPGFPGQMKTLADLYYNRYRDYDPSTGRYIQADPIGLAGDPNPYAYAMNNPLGYADPDGLEAVYPWPLPKPGVGPLRLNLPPYRPLRPNPQRWPIPADRPNRPTYVMRPGCIDSPPPAPPPPPPTDFCGSRASNSEWVPDRIGFVNIGPACKIHDKCYGKTSKTDRRICDSNLRKDIINICMKNISGLLCFAAGPIYEIGVRRGGRVSYEGQGDAR
jgi:RHS repeat-associated protein